MYGFVHSILDELSDVFFILYDNKRISNAREMKAIVGKEIDSRLDSEHCGKAVKYMILHIDFNPEIQKNVAMKTTKKQETIVEALAYMQELF